MLKNIILIFFCFSVQYNIFAQTIDSTKKITTFSGSLGLTNNGFSIVPAFSLNAPAAIILLNWRKGKFSIEPEFRVTPDVKRGGLLLWFRYHAIQKGNFTFRTGFHTALNIQPRAITLNNEPYTINQMRRFLAWELAPSYKINKHLGVGVYYLQGNGLQKDGPQTSHFVHVSTPITNIALGKNIKFSIVPGAFYLNLDGYEGTYITGATSLSHSKLPLIFTSGINKTIKSNLLGNKDFLWNVGLNYVFRKKIARLK